MSWYFSSLRECQTCSYKFEQDEGTLAIAQNNYGKCPKCGGDTKVIPRVKKNNFIEQLKLKSKKDTV